MLEKIKNITDQQRRLLLLTAGILIGIFGFGAYRFASYNPDHTHYHANFAVYVNGEKEQFESFAYYEELTGCKLDEGLTPRARAHMHEPENGLVHIHDEAVTWGNFFENLGMSAGSDHFAISTETYTEDDSTSIHYILNGKRIIGNPAEKDLDNEDRLLVVVGEATEAEALEFYDTVVPDNAGEFNESDDPGTCSSGEDHGFMDRLKEVF